MQIIDTHTDFVLTLYSKEKKFHSQKQTNFSLLKKTGIKVIFSGFSYDDYFQDTKKQWQIMLKEFKKKKWQIIKTSKDFKKNLKNKEKIGVILHLEGAKYLDNNIARLEKFYAQGLRSIGLTHHAKNPLGFSITEPKTLALTSFGKKVIKKCNKLNIIIDLAHLNEAGFYQTINLSSRPIIVSHANCYKLCPHPRNLKDKQLKALAKQKGTVGVFFSSKYITLNKKANINDVINHFKHLAYLIGPQHITIGSDFGGITSGLIKGLENVSQLAFLIKKLRLAGFSQKEIKMICFNNIKNFLLNNLN